VVGCGAEVTDEGHQRPGSGKSAIEERLCLLEAGEQVAKLGSWEWLPGSDTLLWSENLYRIFGLEVGELVPTLDFVLEQIHPLDRERAEKYIELARTIPDTPPLDFRIVQAGRGVRYLRSTVTTIEAGRGGATRLVGTVQDVTDQRGAGRELVVHPAVTTALSEWGGLRDGAMRLLRAVGEACEFVLGVLWTPNADALVAQAIWSRPGLAMTDFESATLALSLPPGVGLPGRVWRSMEPESVRDVTDEPSDPRTAIARQTGLHAALGFPALKADEVLAVLEFYAPEVGVTDGLVQTMTAIGHELGEFWSRRRGQLAPPLLTPREIQVLELAALGQTVPQMAESLSISAATAKTHLENIYRKLQASDRSAAVARALRLGLID
jgi:DNA-binding CsgD family transcriptional regulator